jgi:hypothetical protein
VGGVLGFVTSWAIHRSERADRIAERSRAERLDAYAALLTQAENSLHRFQWLAEGNFSPDGMEMDKARANVFYDEQVTPRYMVLKITGKPGVVKAAGDLREALNRVRKVTTGETLPREGKFSAAHDGYRAARDEFTKAVAADLDPPKQRRVRLVRGTGEHLR